MTEEDRLKWLKVLESGQGTFVPINWAIPDEIKEIIKKLVEKYKKIQP